MKKLSTTFAILTALSSSALACTAEKATYRHLEDKEFTIAFSKQNTPKSWSNIQATLQTPSRKFDFEFTASNGYEVLSMVLLGEAVKQEQDISISFLGKDLKSKHLPQAGETAPEYLFAPALGLWLWYAGLDPQEFIPPGMWQLDKCK